MKFEIGRIIEPKKLKLSDYPGYVTGELFFKLITGSFWSLVLAIMAITSGILQLLIPAAVVIVFMTGYMAYTSYLLTRDKCLLVEGVCEEIRYGRFNNKIFGTLLQHKQAVIKDEQGNSFIVEIKGIKGSRVKKGEPINVFFVERALYQTLDGEWKIFPLFVIPMKNNIEK